MPRSLSRRDVPSDLWTEKYVAVLHVNLVLWRVSSDLPRFSLSHSAWYTHLLPRPQLPSAPFCVSTLLVRAVPLRQHLPVPYNKFSPLVAPFLADVTSSEQEPCPPHRCRSLGPGMWWVLLNGRMSGWAQALIPELHLVPSCFCPQCPAPSPKPMSRGLVWIIPTVRELTMEDLPNRIFMQPITTVLTMSIKYEDAGLWFFLFPLFHRIILYPQGLIQMPPSQGTFPDFSN